MDRLNQSLPRGRPVSSVDAAKANDVLEQFISAATLKTILGTYRNVCELLHLKPNVFPLFYPKLKANLNSWKAKALWKKFDARVGHKCYARGKVCPNTRVLIIGAGPCGLRTAIEAQLLGAKVVVIEKRDRMSRNNVLHLWPFVIEDLRALGAKKFFGKFCAGAIDHISIRQLQCILLKVALLLGVEVHTEVSFEKLMEPNSTEKIGWRAEFKPSDHPVSQYEFDVIIGADGKRNTLQGFKRKEFRGKLAIAITANFINKRTEAEARVEEISGVAFIFNQKFFKELNAETGIDLENIVYYKDDTHYFVMTAKKPSLIDKGVIKQDYADTARLLSPDNVDRENLMEYAREAAEFSTNYQMPDLEFAVNHYGQPDVAMFDFTSMYAAENASKVIERHGYKLLMILVGDSLLEPFWPTGSGCARGFLSSLDACWAIKAWGSGLVTPLEVLAERESIYRLLAQTTPENLNKDCKAYTVDPSTRYPNLNRAVLVPQQVLSLYDSDDPSGIELTSRTPQPVTTTETHRKRRRRDIHLDPNTLINWIKEQIKEYEDLKVEDVTTSFRDGRVLCAILHHYRPDLVDYSAIKCEDVAKNNQLAFDLLEKEIGISPVMTGEDMEKAEVPDYLTMFSYLTQIYDTFRGEIPHIKHPKLELPDTKENSRAPPSVRTNDTTAALVGRFTTSRAKRHAEAISSSKPTVVPERKTKKRRSFEKYDMSVDRENRLPNQSRIAGADEELAARIKDLEDKWRDPIPVEKKPKDLLRAIGKIETSDWNIKEIEKKIMENKLGKSVNKEKERVPKWNREQFLARQTKMEKQHLNRQNSAEAKFSELDRGIKRLEQKLKEGSVRDLGTNKVATITEKLVTKAVEPEPKPIPKNSPKPAVVLPTQGGSEYCHFCQKRVYLMERLSAEGRFFHRGCFKCQYCFTTLRLGSYMFDRDGQYGHRFYCSQHFGMPGELYSNRIIKKDAQKLSRDHAKPLEKLKIIPGGVEGVDLLDRVQTPERIEFANLSAGHISSDHDESLSQMDEDEWTDRNFGASTAEVCSSDDDEDSSSLSGSESDNEDAYEEALEEPPTKEGTLRWMERYKQRYSKERHDDDSDSEDYSSSSDHSSYYENSSGDEEDEPATEGEEEIRARELRKQEVRVEPPVVQTDTGSDTEVKKSSCLSTDPIPPNLSNNNGLCFPELPDILISGDNQKLNDHDNISNNENNKNFLSNNNNLGKSASSISLTSVDYNTADSGEFDDFINGLCSEINQIDRKLKELNVTPDTNNLTNASGSNNNKIHKNGLSNNYPPSSSGSSTPGNSYNTTANRSNNTSTKLNPLSKSATVGSITPQKVQRNFILPPKEKRGSFGREFIPQFKIAEPEPLLIIKRTPSKINLPNEPGKPKVVVKANIESAKKYFGDTSKKSHMPKPILRRSETVKTIPPKPNPLVKQGSLPLKEKEPSLDRRVSFSFEPEEADMKNIDDYIENLLATEDELMKPIDPKKYTTIETANVKNSHSDEEEKMSSSIEDLLKALEVETKTDDVAELVEVEPEQKISDLLDWMDDLDYQAIPHKVYRSLSDIKYKKLEKVLKKPERAESVVSKIPKNNITFFERHLAGKPISTCDDSNECTDHHPQTSFKLDRSQTDVFYNQRPRAKSSIDLDAVSKVDVKKVLRKFESGTGFENNSEEKVAKPPLPKVLKRQSLGNFDFNKFEPPTQSVKKSFFLGEQKIKLAGSVRDRKNISTSMTTLNSAKLVQNLDNQLKTRSDLNGTPAKPSLSDNVNSKLTENNFVVGSTQTKFQNSLVSGTLQIRKQEPNDEVNLKINEQQINRKIETQRDSADTPKSSEMPSLKPEIRTDNPIKNVTKSNAESESYSESEESWSDSSDSEGHTKPVQHNSNIKNLNKFEESKAMTNDEKEQKHEENKEIENTEKCQSLNIPSSSQNSGSSTESSELEVQPAEKIETSLSLNVPSLENSGGFTESVAIEKNDLNQQQIKSELTDTSSKLNVPTSTENSGSSTQSSEMETESNSNQVKSEQAEVNPMLLQTPSDVNKNPETDFTTIPLISSEQKTEEVKPEQNSDSEDYTETEETESESEAEPVAEQTKDTDKVNNGELEVVAEASKTSEQKLENKNLAAEDSKNLKEKDNRLAVCESEQGQSLPSTAKKAEPENFSDSESSETESEEENINDAASEGMTKKPKGIAGNYLANLKSNPRIIKSYSGVMDNSKTGMKSNAFLKSSNRKDKKQNIQQNEKAHQNGSNPDAKIEIKTNAFAQPEQKKKTQEEILDGLYAKVNKQPKKPSPSLHQVTKVADVPPVRPVRQKSLERKNNVDVPPPLPPRKKSSEFSQSSKHDKENIQTIQPVAPPRKKSTSVSPLPKRKFSGATGTVAKQRQMFETPQAPPRNKELESTDNVRKEKVTSYVLPKPEKPVLNRSLSDQNVQSDHLSLTADANTSASTNNLKSLDDKNGKDPKNKNDCGIQ